MNPVTYINEVIEVVAIFSTKKLNTICSPAKIRYNHQDIIITELGLRHPAMSGSKTIHVFDVSDGSNDYRLEFNSESLIWKLIAITSN